MKISKDEERIYTAVFAAALILAAALIFVGVRRAMDRLDRPGAAPEAQSPTFPVKPPEPPAPAPHMSRTDRPPAFILPLRITQRSEKKKQSSPPAMPEPPSQPDIRRSR